MRVAKAKGRLRGNQPKLSPTQEAHLMKLYRAGEHTIGELEELFSITRSTVYRAVARANAGDATTTGPAVEGCSDRAPRPPGGRLSMADLFGRPPRGLFRDLLTESTVGQISAAFQDEGFVPNPN